jgi:hypothetical protein
MCIVQFVPTLNTKSGRLLPENPKTAYKLATQNMQLHAREHSKLALNGEEKHFILVVFHLE